MNLGTPNATCQRCRRLKKGCDRQRPCGRCMRAGYSAEECDSGDNVFKPHKGKEQQGKEQQTPKAPPPSSSKPGQQSNQVCGGFPPPTSKPCIPVLVEPSPSREPVTDDEQASMKSNFQFPVKQTPISEQQHIVKKSALLKTINPSNPLELPQDMFPIPEEEVIINEASELKGQSSDAPSPSSASCFLEDGSFEYGREPSVDLTDPSADPIANFFDTTLRECFDMARDYFYPPLLTEDTTFTVAEQALMEELLYVPSGDEEHAMKINKQVSLKQSYAYPQKQSREKSSLTRPVDLAIRTHHFQPTNTIPGADHDCWAACDSSYRCTICPRDLVAWSKIGNIKKACLGSATLSSGLCCVPNKRFPDMCKQCGEFLGRWWMKN